MSEMVYTGRRETARNFVVIASSYLAFAACATLLSVQKGAWYDEIWSLAMGRHDLSFLDIVRYRWLTDIHPPTFYVIGWFLDGVTGGSVQLARGRNLLFVLVAISVGAWLARRTQSMLPFLLAFVLASLGAQPLLKLAEEYRASLLIFAADAVLMFCFYAVIANARDYAPRDRMIAGCIFLATFFSFNSHYIASLVGGVICGAFILTFLLSGYRKWALIVLASSALSGAILGIWYFTQRQLVATTATNFWAATGELEAVEMVARLFVMAGIANIVVTGLAAGRLVKAVRGRSAEFKAFSFVFTCVVIVAICSAGLLILNYERPFLQPRYLIALLPATIAAIAALAADANWGSRTTWIACGATIFSLVLNATFVNLPLGWNVSARMIARYKSACADTAIHGRPYWQMNPDMTQQLATEAPIIRYGYQREASANGFTIEPENSMRISAKCPTILWLAHVSGISTADAIERSGLPIPASAAAISQNLQISNQQVIVVPSPASQR